MTSSVALREFRTGPLYFFDQPTGRSQIKGTRSNILLFAMSQEETQPEDSLSNAENEQEEGKSDELTDGLSDETCEDSKPDTSSALGAALNIKEHDPTDEYKRAAPHLLNELAALLSQHRWTEKGCVPHGIVNVLNYSWQDLTAGAVWKSPDQTENQERSKGSLRFDETNRPVSASDKKETRRRNSCVAGNVGLSERKPQSSSNPRVKKRKQNPPKAHNSIMASFSISSNSCNDPGWIIQTQPPSYNEPQQINLCQWVVKRLQVARTPEKLQAAGQNQSKTLILRHYGDAKAKPKDRRAWRKANPTTLVNGIPQIPEVKQQDPAQQKLHYRINDGSSFIYYPSGCMAVCHSHSGLPCGGFYTNVFSDSTCPTILATITAFGHGAVSHPPSSSRSAIAAVWDQNGGFICDHLGNITKEWHWQTTSTPREKIIIQLSDLISVRLLSGTSAMLIFRCNNERVQLPLSALSDINQSEMPYLKSDGRFTSNAALELLLVRKSKRNMTLTPVSGCSQKVLQMVRAVEGLEELSARWRRGGPGDRELKRLQQRVRETLDDWLDYYRAAIGIKCPDMERKPDVPLRTRVRREVQSATLPSLNQPQWADVKTVQSENGSNELQELQRQPSAPAERPPDSSIRLPRSTFHESKQGQAAAPSQKWTVTWTPYKQAKEEPCVTQVGPLQIHGNIKPESVVIAKSPESQPSTANCCPAPLLFTPSIPLTVCPVLLRSALLREGGRRRCCCSATLMPVVTDLEYDALVMGHPPHSQQILVVCVTLLHQPDHGTLEQLYRRRNKHRTMPCTQCQMDAFRMVRYEISTVESGCGVQNILLQQRHRAAPGMILMYIRGKLLFVGYICSDHSFSARDLQKQISRTRRDYRLGLDLPPDYKFSDTVNIADRCKQLTYTEADIIYSASVEKPEKEPKESLRLLQNNRGTFSSDQKQKDSSCHTLKVFHGIKSL